MTNLDRWKPLAQNVMSELALPDDPQRLVVIATALVGAFSVGIEETRGALAQLPIRELAQEILKPHWPVVRNMDENEAREKEVDRIVGVLRRGATTTAVPVKAALSRHRCDSCGQDLRGDGYDGHYNIYCHKPGCEDYLRQPADVKNSDGGPANADGRYWRGYSDALDEWELRHGAALSDDGAHDATK
jgi:hypothetical protein